jgi:hypothetical protein
MDNQPPITLFGDSALSNNTSLDMMYTDGLLFFQANTEGSPHNLVMDNADGAGVFALDYVEIVTISGGSPWVYFRYQPLLFKLTRSFILNVRISGSNSSPPPTSSHVHQQLSSGVIVGPLLGGVALLLVVFASIIYIKRRREAARRRDFEHTTIPTNFNVTRSSQRVSRKTMNDTVPEEYSPSSPLQSRTARGPRKRQPPLLHTVTSPTSENTPVASGTVVPAISLESESEPVVSFPDPPSLHVQNSEDPSEELRAAGRDVNRILRIVGDPEPPTPRTAIQGNGDSAEEIRAMRRDVWRLMAIVGAVDEEPPEYGSVDEAAAGPGP